MRGFYALAAVALVTLSSVFMQLAILWGQQNISEGVGWPQGDSYGLFRFDSAYYLDIAQNGYSYDGDPGSSPNIVFAPLFPLMVRALSWVMPFDPVIVGLMLNKFLLFLSVWILLQIFSERWSPRAAIGMVFALLTTAGSYSLHAFYSEASMLFCLVLAVRTWQLRQNLGLALAGFALGLSRVAAIPLTLVIALHLIRQRRWLEALISVAGGLVFVAFIAYQFGNPWTLWTTIQQNSWGRFHPPTDWWALISGEYYLDYLLEVPDRSLLDIRTLNLFWMTLAAASSVYILLRHPYDVFTRLGVVYFLFIYLTNSSSEFLVSSHRFFALMIPIFIMATEACQALQKKQRHFAARALIAALLILNANLGFLHTAHFHRGTWPWF